MHSLSETDSIIKRVHYTIQTYTQTLIHFVYLTGIHTYKHTDRQITKWKKNLSKTSKTW